MKTFAITIILCCIFFVSPICANGAETFSIQGERIKGYANTNYGYQLQVDMPIPENRSGRIKQHKIKSISMTQEDTKKLLRNYVLSSAAGAKWRYFGTDESGETFHFQEQEMSYVAPQWRKKACPLEAGTASAALNAADSTVRKIMDALNVSYEYPFYCVSNAFGTLDAQSKPLGLKNGQDVAKYLLSGQVSDGEERYQYYNGFKAFDDEYIFVFVRLQEDGIPFAYGDMHHSSGYQNNAEPVNNGVFAQFQLTSNGQVTYAEAANLQTVVSTAAENRPILSWEKCLEQLCFASKGTLTELKEATLIRTELCYAINQRHITYPVWEFTIEINYGRNEFPHEVYPFTFYVDAITGECL